MSMNESLGSSADSQKATVISIPALIKGTVRYGEKIALPELQNAIRRETSAPIPVKQPIAVTVKSTQILAGYPLRLSSRSSQTESCFLLSLKPDPKEIIESDVSSLVNELMSLTFDDILEYLDSVRRVFIECRGQLRSSIEECFHGAVDVLSECDFLLQLLPDLLDRQGIEEAVDRELSYDSRRGRDFLNGWVKLLANCHAGMTSHFATQAFPNHATTKLTASIQACPTRQLHITAGNSPYVPFISWLRGTTTRGALVVKSSTQSPLLTAVLIFAIQQIDPRHPLRRHSSLVFWKGGDTTVENALFSPGAFDRIVVWGSEQAVRSVQQRSVHSKTIVFRPRFSISLIGREAFPDQIAQAAEKASIDSLISNQKACFSSLVHYVVGNEKNAVCYCETLCKKLGDWDRIWPQDLDRAILGQLRMLKRTALIHGRWFENGGSQSTSSAVVLTDKPFDISRHPACRLVVVRRIEHESQIVPFLNPSVSALGVYGHQTLSFIRNIAASAGVTTIAKLGESESIFSGIPNDGMRTLSELVNWSTSLNENES